jgi:hypothetical protein
MNVKFPIKIIIQDNKFRATTTLEQLNTRAKTISYDLNYIEIDYDSMVKTIQYLFSQTHGKKINLRIYWLIGEHIDSFLNRLDRIGYYLVAQDLTIGKSLGISKSTIYRIRALRKKFENPVDIDPKMLWSDYLKKEKSN